MLLFYFRFSSHLIEKRPFCCNFFLSALLMQWLADRLADFVINSIYGKNHLQFVASVWLVWQFINVFSKYSGWQSTKSLSMTLSSMECVSGSVTQRQRSHPEHLLEHRWMMKSTTKPARPCVRCAQDIGLVHQVSTQERRGRCGCWGQRSSSAHPRPPRRGRRWAPPEMWHGPLRWWRPSSQAIVE
jgi:hypothetical protein